MTPDEQGHPVTDDELETRQAARVQELCEKYPECLHLRDPSTAPDKWTRDVVALRNLTVIQGTCPRCGATITVDSTDPYIATVEHDADCPGHEMNLDAYLAEHELTLDNTGGLVYGINADDGHLDPLFKIDPATTSVPRASTSSASTPKTKGRHRDRRRTQAAFVRREAQGDEPP